MKKSQPAIFNHGDKVQITKTKKKGKVHIKNGRWLIIKLDNGEEWKGETDEVKHIK